MESQMKQRQNYHEVPIISNINNRDGIGICIILLMIITNCIAVSIVFKNLFGLYTSNSLMENIIIFINANKTAILWWGVGAILYQFYIGECGLLRVFADIKISAPQHVQSVELTNNSQITSIVNGYTVIRIIITLISIALLYKYCTTGIYKFNTSVYNGIILLLLNIGTIMALSRSKKILTNIAVSQIGQLLVNSAIVHTSEHEECDDDNE